LSSPFGPARNNPRQHRITEFRRDERTRLTRNRVVSSLAATNNNKDQEHLTERSPNDDNRSDHTSFQERLDLFLDTPFFNPHDYDNEATSTGPLAWFAKLVKNDYATAEAIFAGTFFVILIVATQELLRMQLYSGEHVVFPFSMGGTSNGALF
jgi:hypothetical protein